MSKRGVEAMSATLLGLLGGVNLHFSTKESKGSTPGRRRLASLRGGALPFQR
jgi:hypothetical protein